MKKLIILLILAFFFSASIQAQKMATQTEKKEMYFRIIAVQKITNDSILALINGGSKFGVELGSTGPILANNKYNDDRSLTEIGFCSVIQINDTTSLISIKPKDNTGKKAGYDIRKLDYSKLSIKVPLLKNHSIFFEFALLDCQFINLNKEPFYAFEYLLYNDSKKVEDSILNAAVKDVKETYEALKNMDSSYDMLRVPLKEGRYQGKSIFEVMANCSARDITAFLNFALHYQRSYMGNTFKVNETFATWVMNKAPYSNKEVYDSIVAYKKQPLILKSFLTKNIALIKEKEFVNNWIDDAQELADKGNLEEALAKFDIAKLVLPYLQNDCTTAYYFYNYTSIYDFKKDYKKVLIYCDSAYLFFEKCGNESYMAQTLLKKGLTYNTMDNSDEALKAFEQMFAVVNKENSKLTPTQKTSFTAKYHHFTGIIEAVKGELKKAVSHYENAIQNYKALGNYSNLQSAITVQGRLARLYKRQGELLKSSAIYQEQLSLYTKLNDKKNIADVLYNIGDIEFDLANYRKAMELYKYSQEINFSFKDLDNASLAESMIAQSYYGLGKYDSAIAGHTKAIEYRKLSGSKSGMAFSWKKLGSLYNKSGEKTKSLAAYDSAAYYYTITKDSARLRDLLSDIGDVYYNDQQYQKAFATYFKWHQLNLTNKNKSDLANSFYQLANASFSFNVDTSKFYYTSCYKTAKDIGDKSNELYANLGLGYVSYRQYDYAAGEKYFTDALSLAIKDKNKKQEANCYKMIASAYSTKLDFDKALLFYNKAITLYDSIGEKTSIPSLYNYVANALQTKGDFNEAKKWYTQSIELAVKVNNKSDIGYAYSGLSFLYVLQGDLESAQKTADSSKAIFRELNNSWQIANSYITMGIVSNYKNDYENSVNYYLAADSLFQIEKDDWSRSTCQNNIGNVYYFQTDYDKSLQYFFESEKLLNKVKLISESHIMAKTNIGEVYYYKKDYIKAEKYMLEGYKLAKEKNAGRILSSANITLGMIYFDTKKYAESEKYLLEGLRMSKEMNHSDNIISCGLYLGKLYIAQNNVAKGMDLLNSTIQYAKNYEKSKSVWELLYEYGINFYTQNKYDSSAIYFKKAVQLVEEGSQRLFGGAEAKKIYNADYRKVDLYNKLVVSLAKTGNKKDALYYADKSNNQAIKEQIEKAGFSTTDKDKADAIKKGSELLQKKNAVEQAITKEKSKPEKEQNKQLIASLESVKNVAEENYTNFIDSLVTKFQDLSSYFVKANPADFDKYLKKIPENTAVLLYVINDNQLFIFTATNKETSIKIVDLKEDINKTAARFLSILRNPKNVTGTGSIVVRSTLKTSEEDIRGNFKEESSILYNLLITPVKEVLAGKTNICIIPNQKLTSIPFQSLGLVDDNQKFHFLVEDYNIFYTNQLDIFKTDFTPNKIDVSFAIFGNPDKSLPGASSEAKNIAQLYPNSKLFLEDEATEAKAIECLKSFSYVHFATHGVLDYSDFNNSYLVFAENKQLNSDGKLTIKKINGLKLANDIVMLSACETAVSKEAVKGWYISPANAFLRKGAQTLIATLWKISDEATDIVETEFYKNLPNMTRSEALRKAQATLSQNPKYSHPFFWSAFVLYGEWR